MSREERLQKALKYWDFIEIARITMEMKNEATE
jgi:hypothetical protein